MDMVFEPGGPLRPKSEVRRTATVCAVCATYKLSRWMFCARCFAVLPKSLRAELMSGSGFDATWRRAKEWLIEYHKLAPDGAREGGTELLSAGGRDASAGIVPDEVVGAQQYVDEMVPDGLREKLAAERAERIAVQRTINVRSERA